MQFNFNNSELWHVTLRALEAAKTAGESYIASGKYIARQHTPEFKDNSSGWPACVKSSWSSMDPESSPDWTKMFSIGTPVGGGMSISDVPDLESACSDLVALALLDPQVERAVSLVSSVYEDDLEQRQEQIKHEYLNLLGKFLNRADALGSWDDDVLRDIYCSWEKGAFSEELTGDLVIPIIMGAIPEDILRLDLGDDIHIEAMDTGTQIARAPALNGNHRVNPFHRAAATHAVVLENVSVSNQWIRWPKPSLTELDLSGAETVIEALSIVTGDERIGYADIFMRPRDWASSWVGAYPPLIRLAEVEQVPKAQAPLWNEDRTTYPPAVVEYLETAVQRLQHASPKISLASRRVRQASLRDDSEDAFLDAMIGVEALLGREHNEIIFRLSLRAAAALAWKWNPEDIFALLKFLYGQRSALVHGSGKVKESVNFQNKDYCTHVMGPWLLRELFLSWLMSAEPWNPQSLDKRLLEGLGKPETQNFELEDDC